MDEAVSSGSGGAAPVSGAGPAAGSQRRLSTILAADVLGYSRMMAADEAGTLAQVKTLVE